MPGLAHATIASPAVQTRVNVADILGIGAQKSATSWVANMLSAHSDVFIPQNAALGGKEVRFWAFEYHRGLDWYRQVMTPPNPSSKSMDISPDYAWIGREKIAQCKALSPDARVFFIMRNPIYRDWSSMLMEATLRAKIDPATASDETWLKLYEDRKIGLYSNYAATIENWRAAYPDMHLSIYDDVVADGEAFARKLLAFLRLDAGRVDLWSHQVSVRIFVGPKHELPASLHCILRDKHAAMIWRLCELLNRDLSDWLVDDPKVK